jgi:hypothetical protein
MENERGWGFRILLGKTPVMKFFATGYVMNAALRISLTYLPVNMAFSGSYGNTDIVLFILSKAYVSSSSSDSDCVRASFFCGYEPKLGPTPASLPFFFNSSAGKM